MKSIPLSEIETKTNLDVFEKTHKLYEQKNLNIKLKEEKKKRKIKIEFHPLSELEARTSPEVLAEARKLCEQDSLKIKLKILREKYCIKQEDIEKFSQTAVSKLERRKDIKISTLMDYLECLGFGLEIIALPKKPNAKKEVLMRHILQ